MTNQQLQLIQDLRHALHQCPEVSGRETRTEALLQQFLRAHTTLELQPCGEGFYAGAPGEKCFEACDCPARRL